VSGGAVVETGFVAAGAVNESSPVNASLVGIENVKFAVMTKPSVRRRDRDRRADAAPDDDTGPTRPVAGSGAAAT
jgi:hypothetical protein